MENSKRFIPNRSMTGIIFGLVLLILTAPVGALAATSGNTTIHNWVSVTYTSGTYTPPAATSSSDVTVATLAAAVNITNPTGKTVIPGAFVTYSSAVTSNANGLDTYNLTNTEPATGVGAATGVAFNYGGSNVTSIALWGGITVGSAAAGQPVLSFPGGSLTGSGLAAGSKLWIGGALYTVSSFSAGTANTNIGSASNEALGTITLTSNLSGVVAAGTQVGESKKFAYEFTAGVPSGAGVDGSYLSTLTATSVATTLAGATVAAPTTGTTTIVESPKLTITKNFRVLPAGTGITTGSVTPGNYTGGPAKPGQIIEYLITILNSNAAAASVASGVNVQDPVVTPYTTYVTGSTYSANGNTTISIVTDVVGTSKLLTANSGYTFTNPIAGGNNAAATAYIVYQVTVN